jgi:hypothetical protein
MLAALAAILVCGAAARDNDPEVLTQPYPAARWRLASNEALANVVLPVAHILVRHEGVRPGVVSFHLPDWTPSGPAPSRTRREAFALAQSIEMRLRQRREDFAELAQDFSEDVASRERGGSLGGLCALDMSIRNGIVLDALAALRPGEVSRVVETAFGFHVFQLRAPPSEETVSGARIVIAYDQAPWLKAFFARHEIPSRSRAEALALAAAVHARARAGESFEALVDTFSDHEEALRHGDFGSFSTRQCSPLSREIEVLQGLAAGEVAPPLDSPLGIEIIRRTPDRPRQKFAMSVVERRFTTVFDTDSPPAEAVFREMQALAHQVRSDPTRFAESQKKYCCEGDIQQWLEGTGSVFAELALSSLQQGQVSAEPVRLSGAYAIVKREPLQAEPARRVSFELPSPATPDLRNLARTAYLAAKLPALGEFAAARLNLRGPTAERFKRLHREAGALELETVEERLAQLDGFLAEMREVLGAQRYRRYSVILDDYFEKLLLTRK